MGSLFVALAACLISAFALVGYASLVVSSRADDQMLEFWCLVCEKKHDFEEFC